MDNFTVYNTQWKGLSVFEEQDPHLDKLRSQPLLFDYPFESEFPIDIPGIYVLTGGRQLGKSTTIKKIILRLLKENLSPPENIFYLPCDTISDYQQLHRILQIFLEKCIDQKNFLFIDELTYVKDWNRTLKALVDQGAMKNTCCLITGSDKIVLEDAITALPGRRGKAKQHDFTLTPLSFSQYISLKHHNPDLLDHDSIMRLFSDYIRCGGYLLAINDLEMHQEILSPTIRTYQDWIIGDFIKLKKTKSTLLQVLFSLFNCYGAQVSFQSLATHTEGLSKDTVNEYCQILSRLGVLGIQYAFDQNKLRKAPRKHRKMHFLDPFILQALFQLVLTEYKNITPPEESYIVESICYQHFNQIYPTYYIKGKGEVDLVYVNDKKFYPIEIKWRNQIRPADLKEISKYKQGVVLSRQSKNSSTGGVPTFSLTQTLAALPAYLLTE